mgnify:CR=1 FL=1
MGLFGKAVEKLRNEFIDIIEFLDDTNNTIVHRFERYQNEIKNGAKLTVREGQVAVFVNEGQIADVYQPGMYTLTTENMPILATLKGWKYGFNSPFKAEVYFVSTRQFTDQKWGTKTPIMLSDDRFGMLEIRAFGTYVFKIKDAGVFIKEIVGTDGTFTTEEINEQLKSLVVTRFTDAAGESGIPVERYAANLNETSELVHQVLAPEFLNYGIDLTKFLIESVSMPDEIKKEIFELSRLNSKVDLDKLTKFKTAKAIEKAAENEGMAGGGMGMGMGFAMANQMGQSFTQQSQSQQNQQQNSGGTPPPLPTAVAYFVAINGKQSGPFDIATLKNMAAQNQITKDTLVWKEGMANWSAASTIPENAQIFGSTPPPLPQQ